MHKNVRENPHKVTGKWLTTPAITLLKYLSNDEDDGPDCKCKRRLKSAAGVMCVTRRFKSAASEAGILAGAGVRQNAGGQAARRSVRQFYKIGITTQFILLIRN
jgi:hypothetical protein